VNGSRLWVQGSRFRVQGSGFKVQGSGFRVQGSGFKVDRLVKSRKADGFVKSAEIKACGPRKRA
jgi:hypothetical protein